MDMCITALPGQRRASSPELVYLSTGLAPMALLTCSSSVLLILGMHDAPRIAARVSTMHSRQCECGELCTACPFVASFALWASTEFLPRNNCAGKE